MAELRPGTPVALGYEAVPEGGQGPGVLVLHAWWGLNDFFKGVCDRLAAAGFVAVAPDLWGGAVATTVDQAQSLLDQRDDAAMYTAVAGALAHLRAHPAVAGRPVGAIGCSLGAAWALATSAAAPDALKAVVLFYGSGEADFSAARAAYLGHFADEDPWEPLEFVRELEAAIRAAGRDVSFHYYPGTAHWFFESDRPDAYHPAAAALAWQRSLTFLHAQLAE